MNITIIGTGFVGTVSAAVYAQKGHNVIGLDIDQTKIESLQKGKVPFYEPGLKKLLLAQQKEKNLKFTTSYADAIPDADLVIVAVGTPSLKSGAIDLSYIKQACKALSPHLKNSAIVAIKSTVPPGIFATLQPLIAEKTNKKFYLAALPEFLKEGTAVENTLHPDRIVIGAKDEAVFKILTKLYQPYQAPLVKVTPESAQMIKYTANAYLATRITFINQIANLCEKNDASIEDVIAGIGYDKRIGHHYWYPGLGYGGSCFPKDVKELAAFAKKVNEERNLIITINQLNEARIPKLMVQWQSLVGGWKGKTAAVLGLSFKPNTNDTRHAPAGQIIPYLLKKQAKVRAYDPKAVWQPQSEQGSYRQTDSIKQALRAADIIMVLIEWPEILEYDFTAAKLDKEQYFIDTRNQFNPENLKKAGYIYQGIGNHAATVS